VVCSHCGGETPADRRYCASCGRSVSEPVSDASAPSGPSAVDSSGSPDETRVPLDQTRLPEPGGATPSAFPRGADAGRLDPGQVFGSRYRIIRELGRGGMGVVYQAWDDELAVAVALKIVRPEKAADPNAALDLERRFKRELVLARQVTHRHVIRIHDLGEVNGIKYFTMPFVQGETLSALIRREGRLPVPRALSLARQIVSGLIAAHEAGIVHRDLKPANIMVDADDQALILDFGIARSVSSAALGGASGAIIGTLEYMAPEQATGGDIDQRADVYAFGLILSELLVGHRESGDTALSALMQRIKQAPPPLRSIDPAIPDAIDRVVSRCLQPDASARFKTSAELAEALDGLETTGHARLAGAKPPARRRWLVPALAALCLVAVAVVVWQATRGGRQGTATATPREPVSVLIADFTNKSGDQMFDGALEQALAIAVEGASFITAYPHADAEKILAKLTPGTKLDEAGARVVARREGIKVLLIGAIAQQGSSYDITVNVLDPTIDKPSATLQARAGSKAEVLGAVVGSLGGKVRTALGETATASALAAAAETFTATSLDAVREYSLAQDLALNRKDEKAIEHYRLAIQHDPQFGRAYAGWAVCAWNIGRKSESSEIIAKALSLLDRMTEREKYRSLGVYFLAAGDYEKAVENYEALIARYPADTAGHANLAFAHFNLLNFPKADEEGRKAEHILPTSVKFTSNNSLYAMYAGNFTGAAMQGRVIIGLEPKLWVGYLPLAIAELAAGNADAARDAYTRMAGTDSTGQSVSAMGLADLALYQGRPAEARGLLEKSVPEDVRTGTTTGLVSKYVAMAEALEFEGKQTEALAMAKKAVAEGRDETALVPAARILLAANKNADARAFSAELQKQVRRKARAYGKVIEGEIALKERRATDAVDAFQAARTFTDLWLARFDLGVAYVEAGLYAQALSEFEICQKRRGEATAIFLDDLPTFRYLAPLNYWLGRAKEGLGMKPAAVDDYKAYLALRPEGLRDPLAADARKRVGER